MSSFNQNDQKNTENEPSENQEQSGFGNFDLQNFLMFLEHIYGEVLQSCKFNGPEKLGFDGTITGYIPTISTTGIFPMNSSIIHRSRRRRDDQEKNL